MLLRPLKQFASFENTVYFTLIRYLLRSKHSILRARNLFTLTTRAMSTFQAVPVKLHCLADLCLVPIGTATPSVSDEVAKIELKIQQSGLKHTLHSAGTTIEGEWDDVMNLIGQLHAYLHQEGILRIQSDIRVGTRTDKSQTAKDKVDVVNEKMKRGFN